MATLKEYDLDFRHGGSQRLSQFAWRHLWTTLNHLDPLARQALGKGISLIL